MVMWREEQTLWDVPLSIETKMKKTRVSEAATGDVL